jgi:hypothetical protein
MAIEALLIDLADAVRVSSLVAVLVQEQDDQARFPRVELARRVRVLEQEHGPEVVPEFPIDLPLDRAAVAVRTGLAIAVFHPAAVTAEVATRLAAVDSMEVLPEWRAAEADAAWVGADLVAAVVAEVSAAAADVGAAVAAVVAAGEGERTNDEIRTYES